METLDNEVNSSEKRSRPFEGLMKRGRDHPPVIDDPTLEKQGSTTRHQLQVYGRSKDGLKGEMEII
jgi:hypothetical protein